MTMNAGWVQSGLGDWEEAGWVTFVSECTTLLVTKQSLVVFTRVYVSEQPTLFTFYN